MTVQTEFFCASCRSSLVREVLAEWPDGSPREVVWICACGKAHGWYLDGGTLDLQAVRESVAEKNTSEFEIYP